MTPCSTSMVQYTAVVTICVPFQLECGKKYGINFRICAPNIMHTKLYEDDSIQRYLFHSRLVQAARNVLMCMEDKDLPQGALIKIVKDGSFLMCPEKMPSRKLMGP